MRFIPASEASQILSRLIDEIMLSEEPIGIEGESNRAILISETHWRNLTETLHLLSIPNMRESIQDGLNTPLNETNSRLDW